MPVDPSTGQVVGADSVFALVSSDSWSTTPPISRIATRNPWGRLKARRLIAQAGIRPLRLRNAAVVRWIEVDDKGCAWLGARS